MPSTRNFKLMGINQSSANFTVKLGGTIVYTGPLGDDPFVYAQVLASGSYTFEPDPVEIYTLVPAEITAHEGATFTVNGFLWNSIPVPNPALTAEEKALLDQGYEAVKNAPTSVNDAVIAKGGWYIFDSAQYGAGGSAEIPAQRVDVQVNGQPFDFDPNTPGVQTQDNGFGIDMLPGDVLTFKTMIFRNW